MDRTDPLKATAAQAERLHTHAHDLRNRLAAIQQVLAQLKEGPSDPGSNELIEFAEQQYFKAMRATEELLDDFAVERGMGKLRLEPIDLASLVSAAIASLQHRFDRKQQVVTTAIDQNVIVDGDAHWLGQLLNALLSNASKFTPREGHVQVTLKRDGPSAIFSVQDTGVGLDLADLGSVFVRYAWLNSRSTEGEPQGRSTLGRAMSWALAHNGSLTAHSDGAGYGSTFTLRLPSTS